MSPKERIQAKRAKARLQAFDRQNENARWYNSYINELETKYSNLAKNSISFQKSAKHFAK